MATIKAIHEWWRSVNRRWVGVLTLGSFALFLAACIWWDQTITFERNAFFALAWCVLNLLRAPGPPQ